MLNFKLNISKILILFIFTLTMSSNVFGFDLKKLQEGLNQLKEQQNSGDNSNPLGNLMKNLQGTAKSMSGQLNQNSGSGGIVQGQKLSGGTSSSNTKLAKLICEPNMPKLIKNLPSANIANLEQDFGKSSNEISKILNTIPNKINDPIVSSLNAFSGAFETKEIEALFSKFISKKDLNTLSQLREISGINAGFSADKKQIKADANFAYGLIHYFYSNSGSNRNLGIKYIKNGAGSPDNIGSLVVYGAWQFYGINVPQNIMNGNKMAMDGYNRAFDKSLNVNTPQHKFHNLEKFTLGEKIFLEIAADNRNPYKNQYQNQLAQAAQIQKDIEKDLASSAKYDRKSGWWPQILELQNNQHTLLSLLGDNLGIAEQLSDLKAKYLVLKSKVSNDNKLVERMVMINKEMSAKVIKALNEKKQVDEKGKQNIADLDYNNEIMIMQARNIASAQVMTVMAGGGQGSFGGFNELIEQGKSVGMFQKIGCDVYKGIKSYAKRTSVTLRPAPKNPRAAFKGKFGKKS